LLNLQLFELSAEARRLLTQLNEEDKAAQQSGRTAKRTTQSPQRELELLRLIFLVRREEEILPIGTVYSYSLTRKGRRFAHNLQE
jgi:hypothetical protein